MSAYFFWYAPCTQYHTSEQQCQFTYLTSEVEELYSDPLVLQAQLSRDPFGL